MTDEEAVPCPFCGEGDVHKPDCYIEVISPYVGYMISYMSIKFDQDELLRKWNNRPIEDELRANIVEINRGWNDVALALRAELEAVKVELFHRQQDLFEANQREAEAVAECRRRKGWDQDIAHWRERAEDAETKLAQTQDTLKEVMRVAQYQEPWTDDEAVEVFRKAEALLEAK